MARQRYYFSDRLARKRRMTEFALFALLLLVISAGTAWSHEPRSSSASPAAAVPAICISVSSPSSATDTCLPLLKSIRPIAPDTVADETQRPAGKPTA